MSTAGEQPAATQTDPADARKLQDSLLRMQQSFKELVDYARYYAELHWDQIKLSVVKYALLAMLGIVMAIFAATLLITGGIVLVIGLSYSLAEWLFDGNGAYGLLLCGSIIVGLLLATIAIGIAIVRGRFQAHLGQKYANKKREQRARYGHDVEQRAAVA